MSDPTSHEHQDNSVRSNGQSGPPPDGAGTAPSSSPTSSRSPGPIYSTRFKILVAVAIAGCVAAVALVYGRTTTGDGGSSSSPGATGRSTLDQGVERIYPSDGSQVLQQETVGVDLVPGWDGTLTIGDQAIPEEDLTRASPRQTADSLAFTPGPDKVTSVLPSGRVCARAEVWQRDRGPESGAETIEWCFDVL